MLAGNKTVRDPAAACVVARQRVVGTIHAVEHQAVECRLHYTIEFDAMGIDHLHTVTGAIGQTADSRAVATVGDDLTVRKTVTIGSIGLAVPVGVDAVADVDLVVVAVAELAVAIGTGDIDSLTAETGAGRRPVGDQVAIGETSQVQAVAAGDQPDWVALKLTGPAREVANLIVRSSITRTRYEPGAMMLPAEPPPA